MATILIVDDISANREVLVTLLRHHGHRLLEASNGGEALTVVKAEHPDLVITDVLMPVIDGYEFVKQLHLDPATRRTRVVFYTAHYVERDARALALSSGVSYILTKPAETPEIFRIVERALSGESETPPLSPLSTAFDREHLRLITDKLSEKAEDLGAANARLRALINVGLELASERDSDRLLERVCVAARDLFGATYITLGIVDLNDRTVQRFVTCGAETCSGVGASDWIKVGDSVSGILGTVIAERRTLRGNPGGDPPVPRFPQFHPDVQAFVAAPIASPAHVYGWICLVGNEGRTFSEDDEHLVMALAGQAGRIFENGYFHAVAQKRTEELELQVIERKQAELAARLEGDRAQRYLDTAEIILLALDVEGRITLVNRYACAILGWTADELLGRDFIETCVPALIRDETRDRLSAILAGPDSSIVDNPIVTRSGEERLIEWRNTLLRDDQGRVVSTISSGTDVTERTHAVEALRTAEERMRFALQNADVGIWDVDYTAAVHRWSETLEAHYGLPPGTFAGTFEAFVERIHPDDRESVLETFGQAMKSGTDFSFQNRSIWPDGTVRWLTGAGRVLLGEHGEPVRGVGISLDVTERHRLEEQFQQAQKMEAIGRLAGGVAHDFNNLLTAILGYSELLLADLDPNDPRQADITEIQKAGESAARLTRQLLALSRKQIVEPTLLDLNAVVTDMRAMLGRLIGEDVKIVLGLGFELSPVRADRGQVEQIVLNLAVNARDAMPTGGTLTIETANVELDEHSGTTTHLTLKPGLYVALRISDTGTGMSPEVQARLFEPFFTTKEIGKGTGLGLATVHGIVKQSGGSVNVDSEVGRGTSFEMYLPRADLVPASVEARPVAQTGEGAQTVLVVEDAEGLRALARRLLERQGYRVLVAANADEALRLFERNPSIDVLLTDVVMPGASGAELTRRLAGQRPALKVIYMSGYTEETIVHHGVLNPGIAFLHKPFTSETLGRKVREVLDSADADVSVLGGRP
jgi:two-component system, cell cycle sensor histidine kinase and response regulator CckA